MPHRPLLHRHPLLAGLFCSILWTDASRAAESPEAPDECRSIHSGTARLACYDQLFGRPEVTLDENGQLQEEVVLPHNGESVSDVAVRHQSEEQLASNRFVITPHRQTYVLPYTYMNSPNSQPFSSVNNLLASDQELDNEEVKFQISLKVPLAQDFLLDNATLWGGYTQVSLWQAYNSDASAPFRETNYEPEIFWSVPTDFNLLGARLEQVSLGLVHQSNGRGGELSRSWNRIYANFVLARNSWGLAFKPWYRIPEDEDDDDNPDIHKYLGYADLIGTYKWKDITFSAQLRNNLRSSDNHTSGTLSMSFPMPGRLKGYIEYVNGYGETLIDYNHRNQRIGIGFILNDWY